MLANDISNGDILKLDSELWLVTKQPERTKPGKGGAYVQVELKHFAKHTKQKRRFSSSDNVEKAYLEQQKVAYLYQEGEFCVVMDQESYEQIYVDQKIFQDKIGLLQDNMELILEVYEGNVMNVTLPSMIKVEILNTEPVIKGATATATYKPASVQAGLTVMVPGYLEVGESIIIKTLDLSFVERAK